MDLQDSTSGPADLGPVLAAAARGEEAAWRRILDLFARRVFALANSRCRNAELAEEITQSVFATLAAKLPASREPDRTSPGSGSSGHSVGESTAPPSGLYTEQGKFEPWLFRIAMNRIRDEVRRSKRHAVPTDPQSLNGAPSPLHEEPAREPLEFSRLRDAMDQLSQADREIIELRHHGQLSFKQISDLLDEPLGTLLARHHRALAKLRTLLDQPQSAQA